MAHRFRPDLCGVMFEPFPAHGFVLATVDPLKDDALVQAEDMVHRLVVDGLPVVACRDGKIKLLLPPGVRPETVMQNVLAAQELRK